MGKVHQIRTVARDNPVPSYDYLRISGGIFHDCAVHDMDLCRFLLSSQKSGDDQNLEVTSVYVQAHCYDPEIAKMNDVDTVHIILQFGNKTNKNVCHTTTDLSRHGVYGYDQRCEIFAEKGLLCSENVRDSFITQSLARNLPNGEFSSGHGLVSAPVQYTFAQRYMASYTAELDHFVDLIRNTSTCKNRVLPADTILVSLLADACEESHHEKKIVDFDEFVRKETLKHLGKSYSVFDIKNNFGSIDRVE